MKFSLSSFKFNELGQFRYGIYFAFMNALNWMIALGSPMILFAEHLGASPFQVGILYSAVFLFVPVQVLSTILLPILGYRKQLMVGWGIRSIFLIIPVIICLKLQDTPSPWMLPLYIFSILAFCFFRSIGACAVLPWLYEILPDSTRGRYFASDSLVVGCAGVITLLFSSLVFSVLSTSTAFTLLFMIALTAAILSIRFLRFLPQSENKPVVIPLSKLISKAPQLCLQPSHFRRFLKLQALYAIAGYAFVPFTTYYLISSVGYSQSYILGLTALQFIGMSTAAFIIKDWVDRIGPKPFLVISNFITIGYQAFWLCMLCFPGHLEPLLPLAYFSVGVAMANFLTATNKYMPQICKKKEMALSVTLLGSLVGFLGGVASSAWGYILKSEETGTISLTAFSLYFLIALCIQIYLLVAYIKLRDRPNNLAPLPDRGLLVRPFRYLVNTINLVEPPTRHKVD
jgi:MFS family permease